jgi:hypothetical protein
MRRAVATLVLVVLLAGAGGVLGARAYQDMLLLRRPASVRVEDTSRVRGWMTVRFVAQAHRVPVSALAAQLGAPADGDVTLDELARTRGVTPQEEVAAAREALARLGGARGGA